MVAFNSFTCENCESEFKATDDAEAAQTSYCSPRCHTENKGLN